MQEKTFATSFNELYWWNALIDCSLGDCFEWSFCFQIKFINIQLNTCTIWTDGSFYTCRLNFASSCVYLIIFSRFCAISMLWSGCVCNESIFVCTKQQLRMQPIIYLILMKYSISLTNIFQFASISDAMPFENSMHLSVDRPKSILFSYIYICFSPFIVLSILVFGEYYSRIGDSDPDSGNTFCYYCLFFFIILQ